MKKILIIEDEAPLREAMRLKFTNSGFETVCAKDGEEGLECSLREHPDMILLDILMPKMDGMAMLQHLRTDVWGKTANVILLTNVNDTDRISSAVSLGTIGYFVKSDWKIEDIVNKIKERLEKAI